MQYLGYYFNTTVDKHGRHEVHTESCYYLPSPSNREFIGNFSGCADAIKAAKAKYPSKEFDGCFWCSRVCHKG